MGDRDIMQKADKLVERWKFSPSARNLKPSFIRTMLKGSSQPGVINFAGGLPAPELFPVDELKEVCTRVLDKHGRLSLQYSLSSGVQEMRELLAERASTDDYQCTPDEIQVTSGAQQALDMIGRVFIEPGGVVLVRWGSRPGGVEPGKRETLPQGLEPGSGRDCPLLEQFQYQLDPVRGAVRREDGR